jgi:neutral amino acid transport system ATP-binding protein
VSAQRQAEALEPPPAPLAEDIFRVRALTKSFGPMTVLQDVSLDVGRDEIVGLIGPNGSGKSTLFNVVSGFERPDSGTVELKGRRIDGLEPHEIVASGLVRTFQLSQGGLRLTAIENLLAAAPGQEEHRLLAAILHPRAVVARERANLARAREVLSLLGLKSVGNEYLGNLSGGQRKLIDIGRMLMIRPELCLFDEPTAGVNPTLINVILDALKRIREAEGLSILVIEHNMRVVSEICERVYVLGAGRIIAEGTPEEIQTNPQVLEVYLGRAASRRPKGAQ